MTHPLYAPNRACTACVLHTKVKAPVPGVGPSNADIMLVGEAPGKKEDEKGIPFIGPSGQFLDSLLQRAGLDRDSVYITNVVKCRPPNNRDPQPTEIDTCSSHWLSLELEMVRPQIVVALGAFAIHHLTGLDETVEHLHGRVLKDVQTPGGYVIPLTLPVYHPAYGLRDTAKIRQIVEDFGILGELTKGVLPEPPQDEYPEPDYREMNEEDGMEGGVVAVDVETVDGKLWSIQCSNQPGLGLFAPSDVLDGRDHISLADWGDYDHQVVVHNYLYDSQFVTLPPNTVDTMIMAYLLGLPQSLKTLALTLCGMEMQSYSDLVRPYRHSLAIAYLETATLGICTGYDENATPILTDWPTPEPLPYEKWDNKAGRVIEKLREPQHITKKIKRILSDAVTKAADPYERWQSIDPRERAAVEASLGPMRDADLRDVPKDQAIAYSCRDADATLRVYYVLRDRIREAGLEHTLAVDLAVLPAVQEMMKQGMAVDGERLKELSREFTEQMAEEAIKASEVLIGEDAMPMQFNPCSSKQVANVVYGLLDHPVTKRTPTSLPSTDDKELRKISHPVIPHILKYRELAKLKGTYSDALPRHSQNGRIHPTINVTRTETGRFSMRDPNLQQVPTRTALGRKIRECFIAEPGNLLLAIDYSQIEMRVVMHLSQCERGMRLFREDRDIYGETAAEMNGIPLSQAMKPEFRDPIKTLVLGIIYGITSHGLYDQFASQGLTDWDELRCGGFIKDFYKLYPEIKAWQQETVAFARREGYVSDVFGRIRFIPELLCPVRWIKEAGVRQAQNMPVTSTAQGVIKIAMSKLWRGAKVAEGEVKWLLQNHDELLWEVGNGMVFYIAESYKGVMEQAVSLSVPVKCTVKVGESWGSMKGLEEVQV